MPKNKHLNKYVIVCENDPSKNFSMTARTIEEAGEKALEELGFWVSRDYSENSEEELTEAT